MGVLHSFRGRFLCAGIVAAVLGGWASASLVAGDDPFRVPVERHGQVGDWPPDYMVEMTVHDWVSAPVTTGRWTKFSFPFGYLPRRYLVPGGTPGVAQTRFRWAEGIDGVRRIRPSFLTDSDRQGASATSSGDGVLADVNGLNSDGMEFWNPLLLGARVRGEPFPGYIPFSAGRVRGQEQFHVGTHCGFDMFENRMSRRWMLNNDAPPALDRPPPAGLPEPFDRARVFAWPAGGFPYRLVAACQANRDQVTCNIEIDYNEWLTNHYTFAGPLLCEFPDAVNAHFEWLRDHTVEEQTEILNPKFFHLEGK